MSKSRGGCLIIRFNSEGFRLSSSALSRPRDFEGFILDTGEGERRYFSRETEIRTLAERVWAERLRIIVVADCDHPERPRTIIIREPPAPFTH